MITHTKIAEYLNFEIVTHENLKLQTISSPEIGIASISPGSTCGWPSQAH